MDIKDQLKIIDSYQKGIPVFITQSTLMMSTIGKK